MPERDLLIGAGLLALAGLLAGCQGGPIAVSARASIATSGGLAVLGGAVDAARDTAMDAVEAEFPVRGPMREAALRAEHARWLPVGAALDSGRGLVLLWNSSNETAHAVGEEEGVLDALLALARRALQAYDDAARLARSLGVDAPALPSFVTTFVGGAQ